MKRILTIGLMLLLEGCRGSAPIVIVTPKSSGGNRAAGFIEMSYVVNPRRKGLVIDKAVSLRESIRRCRSWGYDSAETYDFIKTKCVTVHKEVCIKEENTIKYQCLGSRIDKLAEPVSIPIITNTIIMGDQQN
jgi:hypothetical protein